jgi:TPM domain
VKMKVSRWRHLITIGVFLCLTSIRKTTGAETAKSYSPSDVPNPMLNPSACGRSNVPKSAICDPSLLLDEESKNVIEGFINGIVGAQIAVAVIDEMSNSFVMNGDLEMASGRFARKLHDTWGVGDKETNNGILIFLSLNDRVVYISTGVGVQGKLTRQFIDYLVSEMRPDLKKAQYGTAIEKTVTQIGLIMAGKSNIAEKISGNNYLFIIFFWCIGGVVLGSAVNETLKLNQLRKGRKALDSFMTEIAEAGENKKFLSDSCPICLESFSVPKSAAGVSVEDALEGQKTNTDNNAYSNVSDVDDTNDLPVLRRRDADMGSIAPNVGPKDRDDSPKRAMALHCGHVFCYGEFQ